MKRRSITIVLLLLFAVSIIRAGAVSPPADSLFKIANNAYNEGLYDSAVATYHRILDKGLESANLYYNLGNAYFKSNDIPSAILYYEKAKKLNPRDEDINYNLALTNTMIVDKIEKLPEMFYKKWWNYFYNLFDADVWAVVSIVSFAVLVLFTGMFVLGNSRKTKRLAFFLGLLVLLVTATSFGLASQKYYYGKTHTEAIIFTPVVTVKSSPSANAVDLFVIHEGSKVKILDRVDGWVKIRIQNGSIGWLPGEDLKEI